MVILNTWERQTCWPMDRASLEVDTVQKPFKAKADSQKSVYGRTFAYAVALMPLEGGSTDGLIDSARQDQSQRFALTYPRERRSTRVTPGAG